MKTVVRTAGLGALFGLALALPAQMQACGMHGQGGHQGMGHQGMGHQGMGHQGMGHQGMGHQGMGHQGMGHHGKHAMHGMGHQDGHGGGNHQGMREQGGEQAQVAGAPVGAGSRSLPDAQHFGARLVSGYCTQCHGLPSPRMHAGAEWPAVAGRMYRRMQQYGGHVEAPTEIEFEMIVAYLQENASDVN